MRARWLLMVLAGCGRVEPSSFDAGGEEPPDSGVVLDAATTLVCPTRALLQTEVCPTRARIPTAVSLTQVLGRTPDLTAARSTLDATVAPSTRGSTRASMAASTRVAWPSVRRARCRANAPGLLRSASGLGTAPSCTAR